MRTTRTITGAHARKKILKGVNAVYDVVKTTFGPEGKNALLYRTMNRGNRITNDGVTVAECQEPKDQFERMAAQTFKETCKRTNEKVGDGTTCTTIVAGKLFNDVYSKLESSSGIIGSGGSVGAMTLKRRILDAAEEVKAEIKKQAKKVKTLKDLEKIAIVSVEDEELGKTIAKMAWDVGVDGFIDVVEGYKGEIETEVIKGMRFPAKVAAKGFVNKPERFEMIAEDCAVLLTNYKLTNREQAGRFLNPILEKNPKLVVFAPEFSQEVLGDIYKASYNVSQTSDGKLSVAKGRFELWPVKVPSLRTEQFEDLAVFFGATFIDKAKGKSLTSTTIADVGFVEKLVVKDSEAKEDAIATGGLGTVDKIEDMPKTAAGFTESKERKETVKERVATLKAQLEETKQEQFKKLLERRIASMASAVGIIRVGDSTQASSLYRKLKIEDAVYACKAALRGGFVRGGGLCLKGIADTYEDGHILKQALLAPYEQIQSSVDGGIEIGEDVLDPAEAIYYAVEHATQVVANLITVDSITCEQEDPIPGEGEHAIARALLEYVISAKIEKGQIKEGQEEAYRDSLGGLTDHEFVTLNQD